MALNPPPTNAVRTRGRFVPGLRASPSAPRRRVASVERHLVLGYRPGWQSLADLNTVARHIADIDPTIRTFIVPTTNRNTVSRKHAAERPTLVVSPGRISTFRPLRGKVYQGIATPKVEQLRRLEKAGVPVPRTALLTPDLRLDPEVWGEFVIVKPTDLGTSSHGLGIQLMRTSRVRYIPPQEYPKDHPGRLGPMLVQQYVDTGPHVSAYRVLTFFGEPLSAHLQSSRARKVPLDAPDEQIESAEIAIQTAGSERERVFIRDEQVLALARAAHEALPEIPLKGCDLLRDATTGRLYVIELNCGGNTWHFSSAFFAEVRKRDPEFSVKRLRQFDALRMAARVLVEKTNAEAE